MRRSSTHVSRACQTIILSITLSLVSLLFWVPTVHSHQPSRKYCNPAVSVGSSSTAVAFETAAWFRFGRRQQQRPQQRERRLSFSNQPNHNMSLRKNPTAFIKNGTPLMPTPKTASVSTTLRGGSSSNTLPPSLFHNRPFWTSQAIFLGANAAGFVLNLLFPHAHYHVDLLGTGAFGAAALPTLWAAITKPKQPLQSLPPRVTYSAVAVTTWSVKLASFLLYRVITKGGHDARLDDVLANPSSSLGFWTISCLWGMLCSLPFTLGTTSSLPGSPRWLAAGGTLFTLGIITETVADYQKWMFKNTHASNEFCNVGVWSLSQHPNWFGNLLLWTGIFVMNAPALIVPSSSLSINKINATNWLTRHWRVGVALLSPLFMTWLFYGEATGQLLPDVIQQTHERYGYGVDPVYTKCTYSYRYSYTPNTHVGWEILTILFVCLFGSSCFRCGHGSAGDSQPFEMDFVDVTVAERFDCTSWMELEFDLWR